MNQYYFIVEAKSHLQLPLISSMGPLNNSENLCHFIETSILVRYLNCKVKTINFFQNAMNSVKAPKLEVSKVVPVLK